MMRNTTLNLPDALVQHAKAYAAQQGTTMTALVREHLERVTGYREERERANDPLVACSEGRMAKETAIRALGLRDYAQLLVSLGERNLPLPKLRAHELETMTDTFVGLLQQVHQEEKR
jgi:Family of unknown function (DUF6364)